METTWPKVCKVVDLQNLNPTTLKPVVEPTLLCHSLYQWNREEAVTGDIKAREIWYSQEVSRPQIDVRNMNFS
jgi:hypothetical protein